MNKCSQFTVVSRPRLVVGFSLQFSLLLTIPASKNVCVRQGLQLQMNATELEVANLRNC